MKFAAESWYDRLPPLPHFDVGGCGACGPVANQQLSRSRQFIQFILFKAIRDVYGYFDNLTTVLHPN